MTVSSSRVILPWEITYFFPLDVPRALLCFVVRSAVTSCRCLILGHRKAFFHVTHMLSCWAGYASTLCLWFSLCFIAVILSVAIETKLFLRIEIRFFWIYALSLQIFIVNDKKVLTLLWNKSHAFYIYDE